MARLVSRAGPAVLDLRGRTLMPDLIDCHVHVVAHPMNLGLTAQAPSGFGERSCALLVGLATAEQARRTR